MEESLKGLNSLSEFDKVCENYSALALAYIGDSVFDLMVKGYYVKKANKQVEKYHKEVSNVVKAKTQAAFIDRYIEELSEDEVSAYKRGRNQTTHSKAKNATVGEYRKATGFESMIGYLYLTERYDRLDHILKLIIEMAEEKNV